MMFEGHGVLDLQGDHLDLSYNNPEAWPNLTPGGALKAFTFDIGDPIAGPGVQLGLVSAVEGENLDWKHSVDPVHHHGSDQFRVLSGGEWVLAGRPISPGDFAFQESGWIYQEHPGPGGRAWIALIMGDRRGTRATLKLKRDQRSILDLGDIFGAPTEDQAYPHPAGDFGVAAVVTTAGPCERGYRLGRIADLPASDDGTCLTGLLGDPVVGPVAHLLKGEPDRILLPPCAWSTEVLLVIAAGSCRIGGSEYRAGDLRLQKGGAPLPAVIAGPDGVEAALIVADRRSRPVLSDSSTPPKWMGSIDPLLDALSPAPGGAGGRRARVNPERSMTEA